MVKLSKIVVPDFEDHRMQLSANPSHRAILFGRIAALVNAVRLTKKLRGLLETNPAPRVRA